MPCCIRFPLTYIQNLISFSYRELTPHEVRSVVGSLSFFRPRSAQPPSLWTECGLLRMVSVKIASGDTPVVSRFRGRWLLGLLNRRRLRRKTVIFRPLLAEAIKRIGGNTNFESPAHDEVGVQHR